VSPLSTLIGTTAETSEEKYRLLDQRDRIMRQGMVYSVRATRWGVFTFHGTPRLLSLWVSDVPHLIVLVCQSSWRWVLYVCLHMWVVVGECGTVNTDCQWRGSGCLKDKWGDAPFHTSLAPLKH
jgi:hypothetical protein